MAPTSSSHSTSGLLAGIAGPPLTQGHTGGKEGWQVQDTAQDSIGEVWTRCGPPSQPVSRGGQTAPAEGAGAEPPWGTGRPSWPCPRRQVCAPPRVGALLAVLTHGGGAAPPRRCRTKGKIRYHPAPASFPGFLMLHKSVASYSPRCDPSPAHGSRQAHPRHISPGQSCPLT